ncbi:MAG: hypothetical protein AAF415_12470 [Pseudomonadota bacterium]
MIDDNNRDRSGKEVDDLFGLSDDDRPTTDEPPIRAVARRGREAPEDGDAEEITDDLTEEAAAGTIIGTVRPEKPSARKARDPEEIEKRRARRKQKNGALPALRREMQPDTPALRAERVEAIRRDLVKRRRRKGTSMLMRLAICVLIPTVVVAWFLWNRASPLYESQSVIRVQSAETGASGGGGGLLSMFGGGGNGTVQDSVAVQKFLMSRDVLKRLDEDHGFISHFQDEDLDYFHRLPQDAFFEDAHAFYQKMVNVSFDPTEGVLEMSIKAATPEDAQRFGQAMIGYAEEMVDRLSDPIREAALADSQTSLKTAQDDLRRKQQIQAELQEQSQIFSMEAELTKEMQIIGALETELEALAAKLTNLRKVTSEQDPRVERLRSEVETKEAQIQARKDKVAGTLENQESLAEINTRLQSANFDVTVAMTILSETIAANKAAELEVSRQHRYVAMVDSPSLPDKSTYPKKVQTTALFFLIFLGGYILLSLTISLIREQASI